MWESVGCNEKKYIWQQKIRSLEVSQCLSLLSESKYSDRGNYKLIFDGVTNINPQIIYNYYFDGNIAIVETEKWANLISNTANYNYLGFANSSASVETKDYKYFELKICLVFLKFQHSDNYAAFSVPITVFDVEVRQEYKKIASIDLVDAFPRYYLISKSVLIESNLWSELWKKKFINYFKVLGV